jgi:ComF family protein
MSCSVKLQDILDFIFPPQCGGCEAPGTGLCDRCLPRDSFIRARLRTLDVTALATYEGELRHAIVALKKGRRDVARACAQRLAAIVPAGSILVPVPTTAARRRERGFDGCELMARLIAQSANVTVHCGLVQTRGDRQRGRRRVARLEARGRFAWRGSDVSGKSVTLLDDVATTGATLEDCAETLRSAGARVEQAIVIARV